MNDDGKPALAQVDLPAGVRGVRRLALHADSISDRAPQRLEIISLAALGSVGAVFERDERAISRGVMLLVLALLMYAISGPIVSWAAAAAGEMGPRMQAEAGVRGPTVAGVVYSSFELLQTFGLVLPALAAGFALWGIWRIVEGVLGTTTLTLSFAGVQRDYALRGRKTALFDFAELAGQCIADRKR